MRLDGRRVGGFGTAFRVRKFERWWYWKDVDVRAVAVRGIGSC